MNRTTHDESDTASYSDEQGVPAKHTAVISEISSKSPSMSSPATSDERPEPTETEILSALRLHLIDGVGPRTQENLLNRFGSADAVMTAKVEDLRDVEGVGPKLVASLIAARHSKEPEQELERCREKGISIFLKGMAGYPVSLMELPDPPAVLFCRGEYQARDQLGLAIVGSRRCTIYGTQMAEKLAGSLARAGLTIVSGLARGIDSAAHRGALNAGGRTIAVMGTGMGGIYPPENLGLADEISKQGAIFTESRTFQPPLPGLFPQRNRIISGLSLGVLVVEANRRSGALHTVRHAMEQGREVMAVPGRIDSLASAGCLDILRDGAILIRSADDVLQALGPLMGPVATSDNQTVLTPRELVLEEQERQVLNLVTRDAILVDEVVRLAGIETSRVVSTLTVLEMRRLVKRLPGNQYCRIV